MKYQFATETYHVPTLKILGFKFKSSFGEAQKNGKLLLIFYLWAAKVKQAGEAVSPTNFPYCSGP